MTDGSKILERSSKMLATAQARPLLPIPGEALAPPGDAALVQRARAGDVAAFELLAARHVKTVLGLLRQAAGDEHLAEDAAQEALVQAYRKLKQLEDPARFGAWLYAIALRSVRKVSARRAALAEAHPRAENPQATERDGRVRAAVAGLPEAYRVAVTLRYLEGLNASEIGSRLGEPAATVRARLARGREMLKAALKDERP